MEHPRLVDLIVTALIVCKKGRVNRSDLDELLGAVRKLSEFEAPGMFERLEGKICKKRRPISRP